MAELLQYYKLQMVHIAVIVLFRDVRVCLQMFPTGCLNGGDKTLMGIFSNRSLVEIHKKLVRVL